VHGKPLEGSLNVAPRTPAFARRVALTLVIELQGSSGTACSVSRAALRMLVELGADVCVEEVERSIES